jgi:hypothetical protein
MLLSTLPTRFFRSHRDLLLENLALRQQLAVLRQRLPQPRFAGSDRLFWIVLRRLWRGLILAFWFGPPTAVKFGPLGRHWLGFMDGATEA